MFRSSSACPGWLPIVLTQTCLLLLWEVLAGGAPPLLRLLLLRRAGGVCRKVRLLRRTWVFTELPPLPMIQARCPCLLPSRRVLLAAVQPVLFLCPRTVWRMTCRLLAVLPTMGRWWLLPLPGRQITLASADRTTGFHVRLLLQFDLLFLPRLLIQLHSLMVFLPASPVFSLATLILGLYRPSRMRDAERLHWVNGQCMICQCRVWILPTIILQAAGQLCLLTLLMTIFLLVIGHASILALLRVYLLRLHGLLFHMPSLQVQPIRMGISSTLPLNSTQLLRMFYLMLIWTTFRMHCQLVCLGSPQHLLFQRILSARISKCVWASVVTVGWLEQAFDLEMLIFLFLMNLSPC